VLRGVGAATNQNLRDASRLAAERGLAWAASHAEPIGRDEVVRIETTSQGLPQTTRAEVTGLAEAYATRQPGRSLSLDSAVTQFGHTNSAAGMVAIVKSTAEIATTKVAAAFALDVAAPYLATMPFHVLQQPGQLVPNNREGRLATAVHNTGFTDSAYHILIERGSKLNVSNTGTQRYVPSASKSAFELIEGIPHFDATLRRKERMRNKAAGQAARKPQVVEAFPEQHDANNTRTDPFEAAPTDLQPPIRTVEPEPNRPAPIPPVEASSETASGEAWTPEELEQFLVNFVVEQTGYPEEIVEMDADLEADLGIDSIKKAQLFGELREHFDITPDENLTLDDFPTLHHVKEYLLAASGGGQAATGAAEPAPPVVSEPAPMPSSGNGTVSAEWSPSASAPIPETAASCETASGEAWTPEELEQFLVNFVVEQTGYPEEIVEMDADLEADLGIDSIKKAQLFGELREHFDITPDENLTLDDFPTLQHVFGFIAAQTGIAS